MLRATATANEKFPSRTRLVVTHHFETAEAGIVVLDEEISSEMVRVMRRALAAREAELIREGILPVEIEEAA